jgi:hypothetical protein
VADHRVLLYFAQKAFEVRQSGYVLHLPEAVGNFMLQQGGRIIECFRQNGNGLISADVAEGED